MQCLFDKDEECPLTEHHIAIEIMGRFCQACSGRQVMALREGLQGLKTVKAQLILAMLSMFPNKEEKAREEYQKLMKRVEEW